MVSAPASSIHKKRLFLGVYQGLGAISGILVCVSNLVAGGFFSVQSSGGTIIALALFCYGAYAAMLCLRQHPLALKHSYINQLLQIVAVGVAGFNYRYIAGIGVLIGVDTTGPLKMVFELEFSSALINGGLGQSNILQVNIFALLLLYQIIAWMNKRPATLIP